MSLSQNILQLVPEKMRNTAMVQLFGLLKVPMIFWLHPRVEELSDERCVITIPLTRRSRNHLHSMYFGALCVGADVSGGMVAIKLAQELKVNPSFAFKDVKANFLKRAEGPTVFTCTDGKIVRAAFEESMASGERVNKAVRVVATVPSKLGDEPVAEFELTFSVKVKKRS